MIDVAVLTVALRRFAAARNWEQYHTPKNLALALASEVGELCALYRWLTPDEQPDPARLEDELADVTIFLVRLADAARVDLDEAVRAKLARNESRFPAGGNR